MASGFLQIGIAIGVAASIAIITWPSWKPDFSGELNEIKAKVVTVAEPEPEQKLALKTWRDADGVVHFIQADSEETAPKRAKTIEVDTAKITRLEPISASSYQGAEAGTGVRQHLQDQSDKQHEMRMRMIDKATGS